MLFSLLAMLFLLSAKVNAQNTGITDKAAGITPTNVLQVHKNDNSGTNIQVTNTGTGEAVGDGVQIGVDASQNGFISNLESGKSIIIGGSTDNTTVASDGTISFSGAATVWEDVRVSLQSRGTSSAPIFSSFLGGLYAWSFEDGTTDMLYFEVQMPHSWKEGTRIYPHVHWVGPASDASNTVVWNLEYLWVNINSIYSTPTTNVSSNATAPGTAYTHVMTNIPVNGIDGTGKTISSILVCRLSRNATGGGDTYNSNAFLLAFDIHYEINTVGSRDTSVK